MISASRNWHSGERRTVSSPTTAEGFDSLRGGVKNDPATIPPLSSRPGCLGFPWRRRRPDGWASTPRARRRATAEATPRSQPEASDSYCPFGKKRHTFSQTQTPCLQCPVPYPQEQRSPNIPRLQQISPVQALLPQVTSHRTVQRHLGCRLLARMRGGRCVDEPRASGRLWHPQIWTYQLEIGGSQFGSLRDWNLVCSVLTPAKRRYSLGCAQA